MICLCQICNKNKASIYLDTILSPEPWWDPPIDSKMVCRPCFRRERTRTILQQMRDKDKAKEEAKERARVIRERARSVDQPRFFGVGDSTEENNIT